MNDNNSPTWKPAGEADGTSPVLSFLVILAKRKKLIIGLPLAALVLATLVSFILPTAYKASTKLLPPQQAQSGAAALLSQLGGVASMVAGGGALKNPSDLYIGMLKSRTIADNLIKKFDLKKVYETSSPEKARRLLDGDTTVNTGKDGLILVEVENEDKQLATKLANGYVSELLSLTKNLAISEAAQRRLFYEGQLENSKNNLATAEMQLKSGIDASGVISVDATSRAVVETIGRLRAQVSAKEIQLSSSRAFVTNNNPEYIRTQQELTSLRAELSRLENGSAASDSTSSEAAAGQPGLKSIKLLRDVKYYQMLYELLAKQYEIARLDEAKDPSIIQVLDPAVEPEQASKPKRLLIILFTTVFAFFAAVFIAFIAEAKQKLMRDSSAASQWQELRHNLRFK